MSGCTLSSTSTYLRWLKPLATNIILCCVASIMWWRTCNFMFGTPSSQQNFADFNYECNLYSSIIRRLWFLQYLWAFHLHDVLHLRLSPIFVILYELVHVLEPDPSLPLQQFVQLSVFTGILPPLRFPVQCNLSFWRYSKRSTTQRDLCLRCCRNQPPWKGPPCSV